jgi:aminopeptidase-like protein
MLSLLRDLYPLPLAPVSAGADQAVEILRDRLPIDMEVHEYESDREHNGWVVPRKWEVERAELWKDGELVYDGKSHPLGVIGYSRPFKGELELEELRPHLFHHPTLDDARVYHCDLYYKTWREDWGFSMPRTLIDRLEPGTYRVELETSFEPGTMKVCDAVIPGRSKQTVIVNAHTCHAAQANDDIAGVVVAVEAMKRLAERDNRLTYRFILAPEHLGTVFYVAGLPAKELKNLKWGMFLEMLGNDNRIGLQRTFPGSTELDRAALQVLRHASPGFEDFPFRRLVGNDETVWEAPGVEVPTISLSRFPYEEYHSDRDTDAIIDEARLDEALEVVMGIVEVLETNCVMHRKFDGLIALSNPRYDLYIDSFDPSIRVDVSERQREWSQLMDCLPRYFDGQTSILDIAERHDLPYDEILAYLRRFEEKDLIEMDRSA